MNIRKGYFWAIHMRPYSDFSGKSDIIIINDIKSKAKEMAKECCNLHKKIFEGWFKYGKSALKRVII